jgi:hypothetical protein
MSSTSATAAFDELAAFEAESFRTGAPPPARRLSPALAGLDVIPGRVLDRAAIDLLPDVIQVIALAQSRRNRHQVKHPDSGQRMAELTTIVRWCMGALRLADLARKRAIVIRLRDQRGIDDAVLRQILRRLDIEEVRLVGRETAD